MENRTAFWQQIPKAAETITFTVNGVIKVHADSAQIRQNWWKTACPLSGGNRGNRTFVQLWGRGHIRRFPVRVPRRRKQSLDHELLTTPEINLDERQCYCLTF